MLSGNYILLALLAVSLGAQVVAAQTVFIKPKGFPWRMWGLALWFVGCGTIHLTLIATTPIGWGSAVAGGMFYTFSLWLFRESCRVNRRRVLSVAYSDDEPRLLLMNGPYRFVRHPFYTSYLLSWLAGVFATGSHLLLALFCLTVLFYFHAGRFEEQKISQSALGDEYRWYCQRTAMFIPSFYGLRERSRKSSPAT